MLLVIALTLGLEFHRGDIVNFQKEKEKNNQLLRASVNSVGRRNSTGVDGGRKD